MPRLSIIIPALREAEPLERTLVSVLENRPRDTEIVVVNGCDYRDPYDLGDEVKFVAAPPRADVLRCLKLGLACSTAPLVHFLAAGCEVQAEWTRMAYAALCNPQMGMVAPLVLEVASDQNVVSAGLEYRTDSGGSWRALGESLGDHHYQPCPVLGCTLAAAFIRRAAIESCGGLASPGIALDYVAVDLALRLREAGYLASYEPGSQLSCTWPLVGWPAGNTLGWELSRGINCERIFWRHLPSQGRLARILCHPLTVGREAICRPGMPSKCLHLAGRLIALLDFPRLAPAQQAAAAEVKSPASNAGAETHGLTGMKGAKLAGSLQRNSTGDRRTA